jgi:hypothetical protein
MPNYSFDTKNVEFILKSAVDGMQEFREKLVGMT